MQCKTPFRSKTSGSGLWSSSIVAARRLTHRCMCEVVSGLSCKLLLHEPCCKVWLCPNHGLPICQQSGYAQAVAARFCTAMLPRGSGIRTCRQGMLLCWGLCTACSALTLQADMTVTMQAVAASGTVLDVAYEASQLDTVENVLGPEAADEQVSPATSVSTDSLCDSVDFFCV